MPAWGVIAGVAGGAFGAASNLINSRQQVKAAERNTNMTIAAQRQLAEYSYTKDLEMWNKANAYNDPSAQMGRLKAAGLNPNMVYGSGSVVGNTSGQIPKYQAYSPDFNYQPMQIPDPTDVISKWQDVSARGLQIDNLKAELEQRKIQNSYLGFDLENRVNSGTLKLEGLKALYGPEGEYGDSGGQYVPSLYFRKLTSDLARTQSVVKRTGIQSAIDQTELDWRNAGVTSRDKLLWRLLAKPSDANRKLVPYLMLEGLGVGAAAGAAMKLLSPRTFRRISVPSVVPQSKAPMSYYKNANRSLKGIRGDF